MAMNGNFGNMQQLMKQAQKMQQELQEKQEELENTEFVGQVSGGLVEVVLLGNMKVESIKIDPKVVDPDDIEMLEDMVVSAFNNALELLEEEKAELFGNMPGMPGMPKGFGF